MKTIPYISIKSVIYDLSRIIPENKWNEMDFIEWAVKGLRKINIEAKLETKVCVKQVEEHKASMPSGYRFLNQILYKSNEYTDDEFIDDVNHELQISKTERLDDTVLATRILESNYLNNGWKVMKLSSNEFLSGIDCVSSLFPDYNNCDTCVHEFTISPTGVITTTLQNGYIIVSYLGFPESNDELLIPDNEHLKEAILTYCLWMYYTKMDILGETGADKKMVYYKQMFGTMSAKASADLNQPDLNQLENIKNYTQRLVPRSNQFSSMFSKISNNENLTY